MPTNRTPLTTPPSRTSRQRITRFASMILGSAFRFSVVRVEEFLDRREAVFHRVLDDRVHRRGRPLERFVVALPLGRMNDRGWISTSEKEKVHHEAGHFLAVGREGEDADQIVVGARRQPYRCARATKLGVIHPIDDVPELVGDLVGWRVLMKIQAVLGDIATVLDRLDVALFRVKYAVDPLDDVDRHRHTSFGGELTHQVESLAVTTNL